MEWRFTSASVVQGFVGAVQLSTMVYAFGVRGTYNLISGKSLYAVLSTAVEGGKKK